MSGGVFFLGGGVMGGGFLFYGGGGGSIEQNIWSIIIFVFYGNGHYLIVNFVKCCNCQNFLMVDYFAPMFCKVFSWFS